VVSDPKTNSEREREREKERKREIERDRERRTLVFLRRGKLGIRVEL